MSERTTDIGRTQTLLLFRRQWSDHSMVSSSRLTKPTTNSKPGVGWVNEAVVVGVLGECGGGVGCWCWWCGAGGSSAFGAGCGGDGVCGWVWEVGLWCSNPFPQHVLRWLQVLQVKNELAVWSAADRPPCQVPSPMDKTTNGEVTREASSPASSAMDDPDVFTSHLEIIQIEVWQRNTTQPRAAPRRQLVQPRGDCQRSSRNAVAALLASRPPFPLCQQLLLDQRRKAAALLPNKFVGWSGRLGQRGRGRRCGSRGGRLRADLPSPRAAFDFGPRSGRFMIPSLHWRCDTWASETCGANKGWACVSSDLG